MTLSYLIALLSLAWSAAGLTLTNVAFDVQEGKPFNLTWVPADQAVTVKLVEAVSASESRDVKTLSSDATGGSLTVNLSGISSGTYFFDVSDNQTQETDTSSTFMLNGTSTSTTSPTNKPTESSSSSSHHGISNGVAAAIGVVVGVGSLCLIAALAWFIYRYRRRAKPLRSKDGDTPAGERMPPELEPEITAEVGGNPVSEVGGGAQFVSPITTGGGTGAWGSETGKTVSPVGPPEPHALKGPVELHT